MAKQRQTNFLSFSLIIVVVLSLQIYQVSGILDGSQARRGDWPFAAALYSTDERVYRCGGTVISNKHILTAAHCVRGKYSDQTTLPNDIFVRLGAYNLTANSETDVERNVSEIFVHPDWNVNTDDYDANIAILVLSENITFTDYIRQVSLPDDDVIIDGDSINAKGTVVGWGIADKNTPEEILKQANVQALNSFQCSQKDNRIVVISSARTFCGTYENGNPNRGDSGGGFFVDSDSVWVQYGIISSALHSSGSFQIDRNTVTVYTNVKPFKDWIMNKLNRN